MATAGTTVVISRPKDRTYSLSCQAVVTSRDGTLDAQVGGAVYGVTGHALIMRTPEVDARPPHPADTLVEGNNRWFIVNAIYSDNDAAISCDLSRLA